MLRLYGRARCALCDEMAAALAARGVRFETIDVDADPGLAARYGRDVPVLTDAAGAEICRHRLDAAALQRALR